MKTSFDTSLRYSRLSLVFLLVCVSVALGCSNKATVSGHITFPDGEPLTVGSIVFESGGYQAFGYINQSGFYTLGEVEPGDGIRPGEYKVKILATTGGDSDGTPLVEHVHPKYGSAVTSELSYTVNGKMTIDITVEKP